MRETPYFAQARVFAQPFAHAWIPRLFSDGTSGSLLRWLAGDVPWKHARTSFYEQYELSLSDVPLPEELAFVADASALRRMGGWLERAFGLSVHGSRFDVVAHRLDADHRIGIHNDRLPRGESHRLALQLGHSVEGGITLLFASNRTEGLRRLVRPVHGSALAFPISEHSLHAVSRVERGPRFSLVYSFYRR